MIIAGIDPGLKGGIALVSYSPHGERSLLKLERMPLEVLDSSNDEIDTIEVDLFLSSHGKPDLIVIEKVGPIQGASGKSTWTFARTFECLISICKMQKYKYERVRPQTWKAEVLKGTDKSKQAAVSWCHQSFPETKEIIKSVKVDDGLADALCIAEYGIRSFIT